MTQPIPEYQPHQHAKGLSTLTTHTTPLDFQGAYICPVCRHGQITGLTLMDAFACSFCRHIFTANLSEQSVQVVDSSQPMSWRWHGRGWRAAYRNDANLTLILWGVGLAIIILPSILVWVSAYIFPPLPGSRWTWFPLIWGGCTFLAHFLMVAWLLAEYYQLPLYITSRIRVRALFNQR